MKKFIILLILVIFLTLSLVLYNTKIINHVETTNLKEETIKYIEYKSGDQVKFNEELWYVMYDSNSVQNYVTLIKSNIDYSENNQYIFENSEDLNKYINSLYDKYDQSKLIMVGGSKVRFLNIDDIEKLTEYEYNEKNDKYSLKTCPSFICLNNTYYATMIETNIDYQNKSIYSNIQEIENQYDEYQIHIKYYNLTNNEESELTSITNDITLFTRPVINIYKKYLE